MLHLVSKREGMFALHLVLEWGRKHMNHNPYKINNFIHDTFPSFLHKIVASKTHFSSHFFSVPLSSPDLHKFG